MFLFILQFRLGRRGRALAIAEAEQAVLDNKDFQNFAYDYFKDKK